MKPIPPRMRWLLAGVVVLVLAAVGGVALRDHLAGANAAPQFASGNGRIEATDIVVAAKVGGRVKEVLVYEGDFVRAGQVVARIDADSIDAQIRQAVAQQRQADSAVTIAESQLAQRRSERAAALALVAQRAAELDAAQRRAARSSTLVDEGASSRQEADDDETRVHSVGAALEAARAQLAAAEAAIATAGAQLEGARSAAAAARATVERLEVDRADYELKAPRDGRIQYRVAQPGEVVASGGRVLDMVDLADVTMSFFLPATSAGRVALGADVRLVLDAAPGYAVPARVSFVADVAQFTPKSVETQSEREKLMFKIKARIDPELLRQHLQQVKSGLPGVAWVRLDPAAPWPPELAALKSP